MATSQSLKALRDLNIELLWANLEMLREVKAYCQKKGLPSPVIDESLSYRVQQLLDLTDAMNEIASPHQKQHTKGTDYESTV